MPRKWWVLTAVACGTFMSTLDSSIVNIALPTLTKALDTDLYRIKWVVISYLLIITCFLLPFGRIADRYGRKLTYQVGFLIFTMGSGLCGTATSLGYLLAARALQGIGAAMLMANGPAVITSVFPTGERGKALGTLAMVVSAGLISGPSIGGFLITHFGWRSIFLVNIPIGLLGIVMVQRFVQSDQSDRHHGSFDWAGAFLQLVLLLSFIVLVDPPSISISGSMPFHFSRIIAAVLIVVIGAVFWRVEAEAKAPLVDFALLKNRTFWAANLAGFLTFVSYSSIAVLMPFFLEEVMNFTPDKAGLFMTAIPLTIFVVAPISGHLSDKLGSQGLSSLGALISGLALFAMAGVFGSGIDANIGRAAIILGLCSMGLATGLFQSPNNNAIMGEVPHDKLGVASALLATIRNLGMVSGTGLATGLFAWRERVTGDFIQSFHITLFVAGIISILAMIVSLLRRHGPKHIRAPRKGERR